MPLEMEKLVSLCKRRGYLFQSSEIYGGLNGFWDYGPLGVELKRNIKEAWWRDMVSGHDELTTPAGAPATYDMVGLDCSIIMHPQVWKVSGHFDLFVDKMVDCKGCKARFRFDHVQVAVMKSEQTGAFVAAETFTKDAETGMGLSSSKAKKLDQSIKQFQATEPGATGTVVNFSLDQFYSQWLKLDEASRARTQPRCPTCSGELTEPRDFNLMFKTIVGALGGEEDTAYLRPETAQGIFVNFKNVCDSTRVRVPFGIAQVGKSFRNEITPRNFTFRSREFEQMEIEFFCHPDSSPAWYRYWRDRRLKWYTVMGLSSERLQLREHPTEELSHYSCGTADIEYAFPFLDAGEYGELEGIAHRGDFDLRSHMEGKLDPHSKPELKVELNAEGKPKWRGSGKDLTYRDDLTNERFTPHVIEPSAGADRATLAFLCEAYHEDQAPDEKGNMQTRIVLKLHPRIAPIKVAIFPLVKKDGMPELAQEIYRTLKKQWNVFYDEKGAVGRRYRRQDEIGTPFCITVDGQSLQDRTVTVRDRDTLEQVRLPIDSLVGEFAQRLQ